ncbi:MAG: hypothetical protein KME07_07770 [Pegethrix bostrychoides GSE-TBD4-15B]|uniref:Uncharacterized protein n=1 Tax=Pegethrix bostrychoides GSE-TBD4-15B TaxID=2839662 RepID=A0A951P9C4_9CYAN|nr:hypothetical protein [Pegethrix bostrychoides GSE-TBD4-15B]
MPEPVHAILCRYWIQGCILHAIRAELYRGNQLMLMMRPLHCNMLSDQALALHLQAVLSSFTNHSGVPITEFREIDLVLDDHGCPVKDCHLNPLNRMEDWL